MKEDGKLFCDTCGRETFDGPCAICSKHFCHDHAGIQVNVWNMRKSSESFMFRVCGSCLLDGRVQDLLELAPQQQDYGAISPLMQLQRYSGRD